MGHFHVSASNALRTVTLLTAARASSVHFRRDSVGLGLCPPRAMASLRGLLIKAVWRFTVGLLDHLHPF